MYFSPKTAIGCLQTVAGLECFSLRSTNYEKKEGFRGFHQQSKVALNRILLPQMRIKINKVASFCVRALSETTH
jgi:hypothetical protein